MKQAFLSRAGLGLFCAVLFLQAAARAQEPAGLDALLGRQDLWQVPAEAFLQEKFQWVSAAQDSAQNLQSSFLSLPAVQTIARFEQAKPVQVTVLFYNRGDAGTISRENFEKLVREAAAALTRFTGTQPKVRGKDASNAVRADGLEWRTASSHYLLEYSFTREVKSRGIPFRAEFVRLEISPVKADEGLLKNSLAASKQPQRFSGADHVKRAPNGDVAIEGIPMVDQGQKGYCVVATAERVMRYYGLEADEHELAQIANSSAEGGTSNEQMFEGLKKLSNRLRIRVRDIQTISLKSVLDTVKDYNQMARRAGKSEVMVPKAGVISLPDLYAQMDSNLYRQMRAKSRADQGKFERQVQTQIDQGIPLLWSVRLGIVPEPNVPQTGGGHMRLIIGYNTKTSEIIYSDSWGIGHESKRMPITDAWAITMELNTISPL